MKQIVVGITAPLAAGKDLVSRMFEEKGFETHALSEVLKEKADSNDRTALQNAGDELRQKYGNGVLIDQTIPKFRNTEKMVFNGLRNPGEIERLRELYKNVFILGLSTNTELRKQRARARGHGKDLKNEIQFEQEEERDRGIGQPKHGQQVEQCIKMADIVINNESDEATLRGKVEGVFKSLGIEGSHQTPEVK